MVCACGAKNTYFVYIENKYYFITTTCTQCSSYIELHQWTYFVVVVAFLLSLFVCFVCKKRMTQTQTQLKFKYSPSLAQMEFNVRRWSKRTSERASENKNLPSKNSLSFFLKSKKKRDFELYFEYKAKIFEPGCCLAILVFLFRSRQKTQMRI